jgi:hypothetical protein
MRAIGKVVDDQYLAGALAERTLRVSAEVIVVDDHEIDVRTIL